MQSTTLISTYRRERRGSVATQAFLFSFSAQWGAAQFQRFRRHLPSAIALHHTDCYLTFMKQLLEKIQTKFGVNELPHGMFYEFQYALRFELGGREFGTDRPIRRFLQAHERANAVAQSFFGKSSEIHVLLSSYGSGKSDRKRLKPFKFCGIERSEFCFLSRTAQQDEDHIAEFGDDIYRYWDIVKLDDKKAISEILWLGTASELGINPRFRRSSEAYIVDIENGLALHLYDDRGMDIVSIQKSATAEIYAKHIDWLFDYDIERMTQTFGDQS